MVSSVDHIILFSSLFLLFILISRLKQRSIDEKYWKVLLVPILAYTVLVGLRYGWGTDYFRYKEIYEKLQFSEDYDSGYSAIQNILHAIGLNKFWMASIVFAFLFIFSVLLVIRNVGGSSKYMIMLFLPATVIDGNTYAVRQYLAITFVLFAFYLISSKGEKSYRVLKYVLAILAIIFSLSIHAGSLTFTLPLALMFFFFYKPLKTYIAVILYFSVIFFSSVFVDYIDTFLNNYASFLVITDHLQGYVDNISSLIEDDKTDMLGHGGLFLIFEYVCRVILIVISGWALKIKGNKLVGAFYNFMIFGLCFQQLLFTSEIFRRIADPIYVFYFIPVGYALYILFSEPKIKIEPRTRIGLQLLSFILLLYIYYPVYKFIFDFNLSGFIWDSV